MDQCWKCGHEMTLIKSEPYHYSESGLDNVFLYGIAQSRCTECAEEIVTIPNIKGLHLAIGRNLVCKEEMLTGDEARFLRKELKLKSKDMAATLSMKPETYSRWENEKQSVSPTCDKQLRLVYILNVTEEEGRVLHKNIRGMMTAMAIRPVTEPNRIEISAADWLVPMMPPIFGVELCKAV
ncbi:MAG: type II TA system antitoxin MqsA family protein [Pseudomonadota bacterium]